MTLAANQRIRLAPETQGTRVVEVASLCDLGCVRHNNEDRLDVFVLPVGGVLLMVADGMGGHAAGEVAAQIAVDTLSEACATDWGQSVPKVLQKALVAANSRIRSEGAAKPTQRGMGTTATVLVLTDERSWFAHVGDSRLYRLRNGQLEQMSEDHSLVAEMVRGGLLSPSDAAGHPCRNVIVRALGSDPDICPQISQKPQAVLLDDVYLLCSDGLHDRVNDHEIADLLEASPATACQTLVNLARERGGPDNISVVVCRVLVG